MLCAKHRYDCNLIMNKSFRFYDLKSNIRYIFFYELEYKTLVFFI